MENEDPMRTLLLGILIVGGSALLSLAGLRVVRRTTSLSALESNNKVAGVYLGMVGAVCAVLLAFMTVLVWNQFQSARAEVEREANQLGDLSRIARGFPSPTGREIEMKIRAYGQVVIDEEWPAMSHGKESLRAQGALDELWQAYRTVEPQSAREKTLYADSLKRLSELSDARQMRLFAGRDDLPWLIWVLLMIGAAGTVVLTYFFGLKSVRTHSLMTAGLAGIVAFVIFLIVILDNPFRGDLRVTPDPLRSVLERTSALPKN